MKPLLLSSLLGSVLFAAVAATAAPLGTAFIYQGRLTETGNPYTGNAEFQATLWDAASGGTALAINVTGSVMVGVSNGLFLLPLDFGGNFSGEARWLELEVRTAIGPFTTLTPRQPLTPAPSALYAANAQLLNGQTSATFAPASGSASYVARSGDTMTGALNLPRNGLVAGADQLVLSGGKVGIGTANPQETLHLSSSGVTENRLASTAGGAGDWSWGTGWPAAGSVGNLYLYDYVGSAVRLVIRDDGNLGIGTTQPGYQLSLGATTANTKFALWEGGGTVMGLGVAPQQFQLHLPDPYNRFAFLDTPGGNELMTIQGNGHVGIGTISPTEKLEVVGSVKASSFFVKAFTLPVDRLWYKVAEAHGQWSRISYQYDNASPYNPAASSGEIFAINDNYWLRQTHHTAQYGTNNNLQFARSGNAGENAAIWVKAFGGAPGYFHITENENCILFLDGTSAAAPPAGIGQVIYPQLGGDAHVFSGTVGIGTTDPQTKLEIKADLEGEVIRLGYSGIDFHSIVAKYNGVFPWCNYLGFNIEYNSSDIRRVLTLQGDGNVGIGTPAPAAKLDVNGTVRASGVINAVGGLIIENRTSDPPNPVPGQIWLRTDL